MSEQTVIKIKEAKAILGDLHISPRKVRVVADLIKNRTVSAAIEQLAFLPKKSSHALIKLLNSAVANARNNHEMDATKLRIKDIRVDQGRVLTRFKPRAQGRVSPVRHRTSRVTVVLLEDLKLKSVAIRALSSKKDKEKKMEEHDHEQHEHSTDEKVERVAPASKDPKTDYKPKSRFGNFKKRFFNRKTSV